LNETIFILFFFGKKFFEGFLMGIVLRIIISIIIRIDMTLGGAIRTGLVIGALYSIVTFIVLQSIPI
jgi:hypothetical protein